MTIQQMQYILEVQRTGSITQTAKNLFVSPSSVSAAISSLEKELGYPLFVRSWQGAKATPKGLQLLKHADYICQRLRLIERGDAASDRKPFRVVAGGYPPFDRAFNRLLQESRDQIRANFVLDRLDCRFTAMDELVAGTADLIVMAVLPASLTRFEHNIEKRKLMWECRTVIPGVVRIGTGHRLYAKQNIRVEEFSKDVIIDGPRMGTINCGILKDKVAMNPYRAVLAADREQRYELTAQGVGYMLGAKFPDHLERQYGFRSIPVDGLEYRMISITNPSHETRTETLRYLELLDEELSDI